MVGLLRESRSNMHSMVPGAAIAGRKVEIIWHAMPKL
jgi:hypothetical protein